MVIIVMGVSGSGKTTIGQRLAQDLNWPFYDADNFHPQANVEKMSRGIPLNDIDRAPWIMALQRLIGDCIREGRSAILACSALKQIHRDPLMKNLHETRLVYLKGDYDLLRKRMDERQHHFMKADLLRSQFEALEEPCGAVVVDVSLEMDTTVRQIKKELGL